MKIYEYLENKSALYKKGDWYPEGILMKGRQDFPTAWRQIDPDPTVAHSIELDSCTAVITKDSCYFRDAPAPVLSLEEMQRVTKCMEMLREAGG